MSGSGCTSGERSVSDGVVSGGNDVKCGGHMCVG